MQKDNVPRQESVLTHSINSSGVDQGAEYHNASQDPDVNLEPTCTIQIDKDSDEEKILFVKQRNHKEQDTTTMPTVLDPIEDAHITIDVRNEGETISIQGYSGESSEEIPLTHAVR